MLNSAKKVVSTLQEHGYAALFAGGYVRDFLLGVPCKDIDIVTSATPDQVIEIFGTKVKPDIGNSKQFGIVLVILAGYSFEVATFRSDGKYSDKRHPDKVQFPVSMEIDAKRRDFTINGLFLDPITNEIFDFVGGQEDLKQGKIRFIGNPIDRIMEDPLRVLRGLRFEAKLRRFMLEEQSYNAIKQHAYVIGSVAKERIKDELMKAMESTMAHNFIARLWESGLLGIIIPELKNFNIKQSALFHPEGDVLTHTILVVGQLRNEKALLKFAGFMHDIGKPDRCMPDLTCHGHDQCGAEMAEKIMRDLKFSNEEIKYVTWLVKNHMRVSRSLQMKQSKFVKFAADPRFDDLLKLLTADNLGSMNFQTTIENRIRDRIAEVAAAGTPMEVPKPLLDGWEIMDLLEISKGPEVGKMLQALIDAQLMGTIKNKEEAISFAKEIHYSN